jgi:riboflavin kinase / FMN adenylyltransferase
MLVYRSLAEVPPEFGPSALTIGNFDGVHYGHRQILRRVKTVAEAHGWRPSVLTFDPHPTRVVAPQRTPPLLTSPERRTELMAEAGIEQVLILPFTIEVAHLSPEEFARQLLVNALGARTVLVGDNFRFGEGQAGNVTVLAELGRQLGFTTEILPAIAYRGLNVSSSGIRQLIRAGNVALAGRLLQHAYALEGDVIGGRGVGSKQTVPTLNLATRAEVIPGRGVYVTRTRDSRSGREWNSVTNIGYRPTFGTSDELTIETFLMAGLEGESPTHIRVDFLRRVREERKFATPEALKAQILRDVRFAQAYFRRAKAWIGRECISC